MHSGLIEQVIRANVSAAAFAAVCILIADVLVGAIRLAEFAERVPLEFAGLVDAGLDERFLDQFASLEGAMVIVARHDDGSKTVPSVGRTRVAPRDVVAAARKRDEQRGLTFKLVALLRLKLLTAQPTRHKV